jgi:enoyl-CoA hydratase/carnithine racemase
MHEEWSMTIEEALDFEAQMQAKSMMTEDFERAYKAFVEKKDPVFEGN